MYKSLLGAAVVAVVAFSTSTLHAGIITYQGALADGVAASDSVSGDFAFNDPEGARYWSFEGNQGDLVEVRVDRLEFDLDPAFWVYEGTYADTSEFGPSFSVFDSGFLAFGDDEIDHPGPFGDPQALFALTLPGTGVYTIAVTEFLSGADTGGDDRFDYQITAEVITEAVPEPASLAVFSAGAVCLVVGGVRRRRRQG